MLGDGRFCSVGFVENFSRIAEVVRGCRDSMSSWCVTFRLF